MQRKEADFETEVLEGLSRRPRDLPSLAIDFGVSRSDMLHVLSRLRELGEVTMLPDGRYVAYRRAAAVGES